MSPLLATLERAAPNWKRGAPMPRTLGVPAVEYSVLEGRGSGEDG